MWKNMKFKKKQTLGKIFISKTLIIAKGNKWMCVCVCVSPSVSHQNISFTAAETL